MILTKTFIFIGIHMKKIILFSTLLLLSLGAIAADYENGVHYRELAEQQPTSSSEKIEVLELFWYRCPHCFRLEEPLKVWLPTMPENAVFATMPAILGDSWEFHARVYYTFEALGLTDQFHEKLFNAIHKERKRLNTVEDVASWMQQNAGPNAAEVIDAYNSFAVDSHTRNSLVMSRKYELTGVPTVIVGGKYVTTVTMAGNYDTFFKVINHLIDLAAADIST